MLYCDGCMKNVRPEHYQGKSCCPSCGKVLDEDNFTDEPTFVKTAGGQSALAGNFVRTVQKEGGISRKTYDDASDGINEIMYAMGIEGGESLSKAALRLFTLLVERNFTRGRRKELVQASCLYICCRINKKSYLLIDFSQFLGINVYVLGTVFLQICKALSLVEHDFVQKPVDPSLFIHRFTGRLFDGQSDGKIFKDVSNTALLIIASMKRDWMQTGRKPSGLCGAALYISALSHGFKFTKSDIIKVVHVCEATLTKRLIEFENTESGSLTIEEFTTKAEEWAEEEANDDTGAKASGNSEFLCKHDHNGGTPFAHGLCEDCYKDFIEISGGLGGGSEPPAFQRAERKRLMAEEAAANDSTNKLGSSTFSDSEHNDGPLDSNEQRSTKNNTEGATTSQNENIDHDSIDDGIQRDSETLSDIEDVEVDVYLHTEEEKQLKKIVWEEMNKEYLEEQAIKEEAEKAAHDAYEARLANCSAEEREALERAAAAAAEVAKSRKERQQKRAAEAKAAVPPKTAAEAAKQMLDKKRFSSKIRYDVLQQMLDDPEDLDSSKKRRTESENDPEDKYLDKNGKYDPEFEGNEDNNYLNDNDDYHPEFEGTEDAYNYNNMEEYDYNNDYSNFDEDFEF